MARKSFEVPVLTSRHKLRAALWTSLVNDRLPPKLFGLLKSGVRRVCTSGIVRGQYEENWGYWFRNDVWGKKDTNLLLRISEDSRH